MRNKPPHPFIRFRALLLMAAIVAWAIGFAVLALLKGKQSFPVTPIAATAIIIFVWTNGAFWWLELCYPHIEISPGQFVSRAESSSGFMRTYSHTFFIFYGIVGVFATFACLRVATNA